MYCPVTWSSTEDDDQVACPPSPTLRMSPLCNCPTQRHLLFLFKSTYYLQNIRNLLFRFSSKQKKHFTRLMPSPPTQVCGSYANPIFKMLPNEFYYFRYPKKFLLPSHTYPTLVISPVSFFFGFYFLHRITTSALDLSFLFPWEPEQEGQVLCTTYTHIDSK